jgi:hypothetical protein
MSGPRTLVASALAFAFFGSLFAPSAAACPFCSTQGQTLSGEVNQANLIVYGTLSNAKRDPNEFGKGTTEMNIEIVVKDHEFLKGKKTLTLPRYVPPDPKSPTKYLVFCEVYKGQLDPYRGEAVPPNSKIAEYLKGAIAVRDKDAATRLDYFFKYLDSSEQAVSIDALMEFGNADYKDQREVFRTFPAATVVKWLKDPSTSAARFGLYGSILGHCGNAKEHAPLLRAMLDDPKKRYSSGMDGMLAGYVLLDPKEGWKYVAGLMADEKQEFLIRYAALRTARFFWDYQKDVIPADAIVAAMLPLLDQGDIADLPIDDLRRWGRWELTGRILGYYGTKSHSIPIVKRAIIRFALCAPADNAVAAAFLKQRRAEEPERVRDIEQLLELEKAPPKPESKTTATTPTPATKP